MGRESARAIREPRIAIIDVKPTGQGEIGFWISGILDKSNHRRILVDRVFSYR